MSETENLGKYHEFADKLSASRKMVDEDESLRYSFESQQALTQELKKENERGFYRLLSTYFLLFSVFIFLIHLLFEGLWVGLIGLIVSIVFYVAGKIMATRRVKKVTQSDRKLPDGKLLVKKDLENIRHYNLSIIDLKLFRYYHLMLMTVILTPLIFLSIHELIFGTNTIIHIGMAILLGSFFWMIYFNGNIDLLRKLREKTLKA